MAFVAFILSLLIALIGAVGTVAPSVLVAIVTSLRGPFGLAFAAGLRIVLGFALFLAAPTSRAPYVFRALGAVMIFVGLLMPFMSVERFDGLVTWWSIQGPLTVRLWAAFALTFGVLVAYGIIPREAR